MSLFLRKPRNAGLRAHNGEIVGNGNWPALIDESTWKAAQAKLSEPGRAPGRKTVRRHLLTGVLKCGKPGCDGRLAGYQTLKGVKAYRCKRCLGVGVRAADIEPLLYDMVAGRLVREDAADLLKAEIHDAAEAEAVRLELASLYGELDKLAVERAEGLLTARQVKISTDVINDKIAKLKRRHQDQERLRVFEDIPLGTPEAADAVTE